MHLERKGVGTYCFGAVKSKNVHRSLEFVIKIGAMAARFEDEEDGEDEEDEEQESGAVNIGKTFLIPRARMSLYDQDIFASGLLEARDKVSSSDAI